MTTDSQLKMAHPLQDFYSKIYAKYDLINRIFTLGMDKRWRNKTVKECLSNSPAKILDLCCGTGDLSKGLIKRGIGIKVTGYDFSKQMLSIAQQKVSSSQSDTIEFIQGDAAKMPFGSKSFNALTIGFGFRNLVYENPNAAKHISEMNRVLDARGKLYILESAVPKNPLVRFFYQLYLHLFLIPVGGLITGNWKAYRYLALSSLNYFTPKELDQFLSQHGFRINKNHTFFMGAANLVIAEKTSDLEPVG